MKSKLIVLGAVAAVAAVAPASTASAHIKVAVTSVKAHTDRADAALDRAVSLFEQNADRRGTRELARSRRELGRATAETAKLRRTARTENQRGSAARAAALVAAQRDENIEPLVGVLDEVEGKVENTVAKTALFDTRARDKAIRVITALLSEGRVPAQAANGLARALVSLSQGRDVEVVEEAEALVDNGVSSSGKRTVVRTLIANVVGQTAAAAKLAELIADPDRPAESKPGLQQAYDAVSAEHGSIDEILARFSDRMPAEIRAFVEQIITQARTNAQAMRESRPGPPAGGGPPTTTQTPPAGLGLGGPPFAG